jgi:hypothetical protein
MTHWIKDPGKIAFSFIIAFKKFPVSAFEAYKAVFILNDNLIAFKDNPGPRLLAELNSLM